MVSMLGDCIEVLCRKPRSCQGEIRFVNGANLG